MAAHYEGNLGQCQAEKTNPSRDPPPAPTKAAAGGQAEPALGGPHLPTAGLRHAAGAGCCGQAPRSNPSAAGGAGRPSCAGARTGALSQGRAAGGEPSSPHRRWGCLGAAAGPCRPAWPRALRLDTSDPSNSCRLVPNSGHTISCTCLRELTHTAVGSPWLWNPRASSKNGDSPAHPSPTGIICTCELNLGHDLKRKCCTYGLNVGHKDDSDLVD